MNKINGSRLQVFNLLVKKGQKTLEINYKSKTQVA
jgi:hypothetical protein